MLFLFWMFVDVTETVVALLLLCNLGIVQSFFSPLSFFNRILPQLVSQLCKSCSQGLFWLVVENNDMSFFQLFQYCLGSRLGTIGDFFSEQLLHDAS